jgi:predicted PurR-regulated permease PerM
VTEGGKLGPGSRAILLLAAFVIVLAAMKLAAPVLVPLFVAACIAAAMMPVVTVLRRRGMKRYLAVAITTVAVLAGLVAFGVLVGVAIGDLTESLPKLETALAAAKTDTIEWLQRQRLWSFTGSVRALNPGDASSQLISGVLLALPAAISALGVVFFVAVFILLEGATFNDKLHRALRWSPARLADVQHTISEIQRYLLFKGGLSLATGLFCGAWSAVLRQPHAIVWGLVTFLLSFIPAFGSIVTTSAASIAAFVQLGPGPGLLVLGGYTVIHTLIGNLVEPKVLGRAAGLSSLVVLIAVVVWGWVLGPIGALLAVPLTMMMKIVLAHTDDLRWVAVLLGPGEGKGEEEYVEERRRSRSTQPGTANPEVSGKPAQPVFRGGGTPTPPSRARGAVRST